MARYAVHPLAHHRRMRIGAGTLQKTRVPLNQVARLWRLWRRRSHERRLAAQFSDRDLWDVGLTRGDIHREFARPFWQADLPRIQSPTTENAHGGGRL
jgi:uncharacterized protein YjiS (DUF1127 family)